MADWISVGERLPDDAGEEEFEEHWSECDFWVVHSWGDGLGGRYRDVYLATYNGGGKWQIYDTSAQLFIYKDITHWMLAKLPEPPKEEDNGS